MSEQSQGPRSSRILPAVVIAFFVMVAAADLVVVIVYGNYRNLVEQSGVGVSFAADDPARPVDVPLSPVAAADEGGVVVDGRVLVDRDGDRLTVRAPGLLILRFRAPDAGATVELDYAFLDPATRGRCRVVVARVASRYGVDIVRRARIAAGRRARGTFRHYLADHAGWFELQIRVDPAAARGGFRLTLPRIVR